MTLLPSTKLHGATLCLALLAMLSNACQKQPPVPSAEDRRVAKNAIPLSEVLLMMRGGYKEQEVLAEVTRRRVSEPVDPVTENKLLDVRASAGFIAALKAKDNVLTETQKIAFDEIQAERQALAQQDADNRMRAAAIEQAERNEQISRSHFYQQQTLNNIRVKEQAQASYEQAERNYKSRRQFLEQQIQYLENNINRRRSYGAREDDLRVDNQTLERYREELRNLVVPMRPL